MKSYARLGAAFLGILLVCNLSLMGMNYSYLQASNGAAPEKRCDPPPNDPGYAFNAERDTVTLTPDEAAHVRAIHARVASFDPARAQLLCPDRYLYAHLNPSSGRHHNQLEMLMNSIMWAERLNRTAVIGWFNSRGTWIHHAGLYDFSEISRHFCVVTPETMQSRLTQKGQSPTFVCHGQCFLFENWPIYPFLTGNQRAPYGGPSIFGYLTAEAVVRHAVLPPLSIERATVLVVDGAIMFNMRAGLAHHAAVYGLLRPSKYVDKQVKDFLRVSFAPQVPFFVVHKRHREGTCLTEMGLALPKVQLGFETTFDAKREHLIRSQCNISVPYISALQASLGMQPFSIPLFVAHDGQDTYIVPQLVARGARVYDEKHYPGFADCHDGLCSLAVDYFVMLEGRYFTGNALSSVSHNVCFGRLGRGRACHGMESLLIRMMAYNVAEQYPLLV